MFDKLKKNASKAAAPEVESSEKPAAVDESGPPPSYLTESAVHSYDIKYKDWKCTKGLVHDLETGSTIYQFDVPTLTRSRALFRSLPDEAELGRGQVNMLKKNLAIELHGREFTLRVKKALSADYLYESPVFGNQTMTWKFHQGWSTIGFVLLDEQSLPVARWTLKGGVVFTDLGKLELLGSKAESKEAKEEILLTGFTLIYLMIESRSSA